MRYAQLPFEEVAVASHRVLLVLAKQAWGLAEINRTVKGKKMFDT